MVEQPQPSEGGYIAKKVEPCASPARQDLRGIC